MMRRLARPLFLRRDPRLLDVATEALLLLVQPGHDSPMCAPRGPLLEELVHALERDALRLRQQEEDEEYGQDHQRREEEVHAVPHRREHLRREARDEEVPQPVGAGGAGLREGAHLGVEHFLSIYH